MQNEFREAEGPKMLIELLTTASRGSEVAHRVLLMLQVLADKEADRKCLIQYGAADAIKPYLGPGFGPEVSAIMPFMHCAKHNHCVTGYAKRIGHS
jgi:hypothetical protein